MTKQRTIKNLIKKILLAAGTFADGKFNPRTKPGVLATLVRKILGLSQTAAQETKNISPQQQTEPQAQQQQTEPHATSDVPDTPLLNSHQVYGIVLSAMQERMKRQIFPRERVSDIRREFYMQHPKGNFDEVLMNGLEAQFNVPIQIVTDTQSNPKMGIYNIANQTMDELITYGKAMPPEVEFAGMNKWWIPLYKSMTFNTTVNILYNEFGILASVKTISKCKSFASFDKYVTTLMVRNKVNKIVFGDDESVVHQNLSDTVISAQDAESITQNVQNVFHIKVDYNISGTKLGELYKYIYRETNASKELRYQLFGRTYKEPEPFVLKISIEELQELRCKLFGSNYKETVPSEPDAAITRNDIFTGIIARVNRAISRTGVQNYTNIYKLKEAVRSDTKKYDALQALFDDLESIGIQIDTSNEQLLLKDICNVIHNTLIERGASIPTRVPREDMDPVWGTIQPSINFNKLEFLLEYGDGIDVSVSKLMRCKTYDDYKTSVLTAQTKEIAKQSR